MREEINKTTEKIAKLSQNVGAVYPILREECIPESTKRIIVDSVLMLMLSYGAEC